jgi:hypothetical protein
MQIVREAAGHRATGQATTCPNIRSDAQYGHIFHAFLHLSLRRNKTSEAAEVMLFSASSWNAVNRPWTATWYYWAKSMLRRPP